MGLMLVACNAVDTTPVGELPTVAVLPEDTARAAVIEITEARATIASTTTPTATFTATASITPSETVTVAPSATITETPSATPTDLPTLDPNSRPLAGLALLLSNATAIVPATNTPFAEVNISGIATPLGGFPNATTPTTNQPASCQFIPSGGFGPIFQTNPDIAAQLGCPLGNPPSTLAINAAWQDYQGGLMIWLNGTIYTLISATDSFQTVNDSFQEGVDPETSTETPPDGLVAPVRGFLKVWSTSPNVRQQLGWALNAEQGVTATVQEFDNGRMIWIPGRQSILVLIGNPPLGTWRSFSGTF